MQRWFIVFFVFCTAYCAPPSILRVIHSFPLGTLCSGWERNGGVAWLVDADQGLFVACHGAMHFGAVSHSLGGVELFPEEGPSIRCQVVYADWANRVSLLAAVEEDKPFVKKLTPGVLAERLCQQNEKVRVASVLSLSPLFSVWEETAVIDPWVLKRGAPQMFAVPRQACHEYGTPIVDKEGKILGVIVDEDNNRSLFVQGRHIAYTLEKWNAGQREAPGFLCSWNFEENKPDFDLLVGGSTNGVIVADWGPETLQERDYYGSIDLSGLDERFKVFRGYGVQKNQHLGVHRTHRILCSGPDAPIVGDVIWAVWDGDHEIALYGDPLKLLRVIDKARKEKKDFVEWTVLRKDKSHKVRVPLAQGTPATEVVFFGNLACSNETVPGYEGVVGVHPSWQKAAFFIDTIDGVSVKNLDEVKKVLSEAGDVVGVGAYHSVLQGYDVMHGTTPLENTQTIIYYTMGTLLARMQVFKKEQGVWYEKA